MSFKVIVLVSLLAVVACHPHASVTYWGGSGSDESGESGESGGSSGSSGSSGSGESHASVTYWGGHGSDESEESGESGGSSGSSGSSGSEGSHASVTYWGGHGSGESGESGGSSGSSGSSGSGSGSSGSGESGSHKGYSSVFFHKSETGHEEKHEEHESPAHYAFGYHVGDHHSHDFKGQEEKREGKTVHGSYTLIEPDGTKRIVEYYDEGHGFNAVVKRLPYKSASYEEA